MLNIIILNVFVPLKVLLEIIWLLRRLLERLAYQLRGLIVAWILIARLTLSVIILRKLNTLLNSSIELFVLIVEIIIIKFLLLLRLLKCLLRHIFIQDSLHLTLIPDFAINRKRRIINLTRQVIYFIFILLLFPSHQEIINFRLRAEIFYLQSIMEKNADWVKSIFWSSAIVVTFNLLYQ